MRSLHARLDPIKAEVLRVTETFGQLQGMRAARVQSYDCFRRWLKDVTGDENFGRRPKISLDGHQTLGDQLVDAFLRKVVDLEAEHERLKERIKYLEWQLSLVEGKEEQQALAILDVCQV